MLLFADHPQRVRAATSIGHSCHPAPRSVLVLMPHPRVPRALVIRQPVAASWLKFNVARGRSNYQDFIK